WEIPSIPLARERSLPPLEADRSAPPSRRVTRRGLALADESLLSSASTPFPHFRGGRLGSRLCHRVHPLVRAHSPAPDLGRAATLPGQDFAPARSQARARVGVSERARPLRALVSLRGLVQARARPGARRRPEAPAPSRPQRRAGRARGCSRDLGGGPAHRS